MKVTAATLALVAVVILVSTDGALAVGRRKCRRLARRQRQLAVRDDFPGIPCGSSDIRRAINARCDAGLCAPLRRGPCKRAIRSALVNDIFPANCIVPTCEPEMCTTNTCRSTVDLTLAFPANCPELCSTLGDCPAASCTPEVPTCGSGFKRDNATCSCIQDPVVECTRDNQCPDINLCRPGVCTDEGICENFSVGSCCVNNRAGRLVDDQCTTTTPVCGASTGTPVGTGATGNKCFFCEDDRASTGVDNGCTSTSPFCAAVSGVSVGTDGLGDACFSCQTTASPVDTGCASDKPFCGVSTLGIPAALGDFGNTCFSCINDGDNVDTGCTSAAPSCNAESGRLGSSCLTCRNSAPGAGLDFGCSPSRPICSDGSGNDIGTNQEGSQCVVCLSETVTGAIANTGCSTATPNCRDGDMCVFCSKFSYGDDFGCPPTASVCGTAGGMPLVNEGDVGSQCFFCQNTSEDLDPGCSVGVCVAEEGQLGSTCAVCQNDRGSDNIADLGCDDTAKKCSLTTGSLAINGFGNVCVA